MLWDHCNEELCHHFCCGGVWGQYCHPMLVERFHTKWREGTLSLRTGSVQLWSCPGYWTSFISCYSFCSPSIHSLPRFTANPTVTSWLEVGRTHLLLNDPPLELLSAENISEFGWWSKVRLRINILNMWKLIWHSFLSILISGYTAKCFRIACMRKCNRIEDTYPKFERCLHCLMAFYIMFGKLKVYRIFSYWIIFWWLWTSVWTQKCTVNVTALFKKCG